MSITVISEITQKNAGNFPVVSDVNVKGGFQIVADATARDAIPMGVRKQGMWVLLQSTDVVYELGSDLTTWTARTFGAALASAAPAIIQKQTASAGTGTTAARDDHAHQVSTAAAGTATPGDAAAEGTATSLARSDHKHQLPAFGTTSGTFCQGNDSRLSDDRTASGIRTASTIVSCSGATAPSANQVLIASSGTAAAWAQLAITQLAIAGILNGMLPIFDGSAWRGVGIKTSGLSDSDQTINVSTASAFSFFGPYTANRTITLGTTGAVEGSCITLVLCDVSASTVTINNGGPNTALNPLYTKPTGKAMIIAARFDGVDWEFAGIQELVY